MITGHAVAYIPRSHMRHPGDTRADSSVQQGFEGGSSVMPHSSSSQPRDQQQPQSSLEIDADGNFDLGDEGGAATEVSAGCFSRLSPTFIVYMSAFVSSLTSVLLGYGECRRFFRSV